HEKGYQHFVYAPVGFVSDHLEVLFDNDYECKVVCDELGVHYYRPEMPNTDPQFIETLAKVVLDKTKNRSEEHTSELQSRFDLVFLLSFPTRRSSDLHEKGYQHFVYAPVGFVSDHLEVLFDNDYECKVVCDELGVHYYRPEMPNTDPQFIETLAKVVLDKTKN